MLGMTSITEAEKRHPKVLIGIGGGVVLSILVMGGNLTYQWGRMAERVDVVERSNERAEERRDAIHATFVTRQEYTANNDAVLREMQNQAQATRDLARQVERLANQQQAERSER